MKLYVEIIREILQEHRQRNDVEKIRNYRCTINA